MTTEAMNTQPREFAKFGGFQFLHQMEVCFSSLTTVLEKILNSKVQEFPHPTGVLLANIYQNAKAAGALAPDGLLNETYLLMRVLVDTGVSFCYLLEADESERKKYLAQTRSSTNLKSGTPEDLLQQAKSTENFDATPPHKLQSIRKRIDALAEKGIINRDAWLMVVASVFPHSSEILSGGAYAYTFRFLREDDSKRIRRDGDEFSMLYFMVGEFLFELICLCSKRVNNPQFQEEAKRFRIRLMELMEQAHKGIEDSVQGTWGLLERVEHLGMQRISKHLDDVEDAFELTYEAGVIAPTLRKADQPSEFRHAALYFRRALNDFRAVWILLAQGYTSQASTCAGSLFEASLAAICLLKPENVRDFEAKIGSATGNDFPWKPMKMAKIACADGNDIDDPSPEYQNAWRSLYARYAWLSKIRHSTFQSVLHDTTASSLDCGNYVVMAIPNSAEEDIPVKMGIAVGALADLQHAISAMIKAFGYGEETGNPLFDERMRKSGEKIAGLVEKFSTLNNPITIQRTEFMRRHPPVSKNKSS